MSNLSATPAEKVGRETYWTAERVVASIRRWVELYGEPPKSADWNPSSAKWSAATWRIDRYRAGDPETGESWPSLNAAKKPFGGRMGDAIKAAGFEPNKPGPRNRKDIRPEVVDRQVTPEVRSALDAAAAEARDLRKTLEVRERQLEKARNATTRYREERDAARRQRDGKRLAKTREVVRTKTKTKTVVKADRKAIRAAEAAVRAELKAEMDRLKLEVADARRAASKAVGKQERSEATVNEVRGDRREMKRELDRALDREAGVRAALEREKARDKPAPVRVVEKEVVELPGPEAREVAAARALAVEAERRIAEADVAVARAERELKDVSAMVTGERRRLTPAEVNELKQKGPGW